VKTHFRSLLCDIVKLFIPVNGVDNLRLVRVNYRFKAYRNFSYCEGPCKYSSVFFTFYYIHLQITEQI